jgi:alpha-beta hydrolase superfamily lysophospholipase
MARHFISEHGEALSGVVLTGSNSKPAQLTVAVVIIARIERLRMCLRGRSPLVHSLTFGTYNKQFEPVRTDADWLSRDSAEVDKYVADPLCQFRPTLQLWIDLLSALDETAKLARQKRIPKQLPIYVTAGPGAAPFRLSRRRSSTRHMPLLPRGPPRALQRDQPGRGDPRVARLAG